MAPSRDLELLLRGMHPHGGFFTQTSPNPIVKESSSHKKTIAHGKRCRKAVEHAFTEGTVREMCTDRRIKVGSKVRPIEVSTTGKTEIRLEWTVKS